MIDGIAAWRLHLLRAVYLLMALGAGYLNWSQIIDPTQSWKLMEGVVVTMLGAMSALALLGLRHPLRMLPLMFWEIAWKLIWLARVAFPAWQNDTIDEGIAANIVATGMVVIVIAVVPWDYVWRIYVKGAPS
ncbi:hypothetical protein [Niveispirillum cyanobacteriorum]|uniref:Uncharacterized protein n=1 Tax=Niveispirillum cyanobacteriorum TaxID=1612173 RepID=A0A2K9N9F0_9PROT|nr:hypothetical protein [Niveispirillum cyanobacteriorum]AUN29748.1 hypothetical protein C0V82_05570 [Niveispirillum cyanobacteriorum]GGE61128.1 hypothetical protein GCM10011317_18600 [Niveispirillum cyanobacteriorum]